MLIKTKTELLAFYHERCIAYAKVFDKQNKFLETVMRDLETFCRAYESTFHVDPRAHALMEGRREVYLRIQEFLTMNAETLLMKHTKEKE